MKHPQGPQQIIIAGREVKWDRETISYEEIVAEWNKLDPSRTVEGQPGIDWKNEYAGGSGILYPGESVKVQDGLVITIDPSHLS
ncbi:hypothetical protein F4212_06780 [Candidatus Poribacteria bacterium]|nr:hypothetical protein [Candidatus Poribacteria bacterium]